MVQETDLPKPRIYPMGMHRGVKDAAIEAIPERMIHVRKRVHRSIRTGEETAVIFARISRTAGTFDSIAQDIDEEGAARFHQKWTVSVEGYGHSSVGEHAPIQMAIENVSSADGDEITDNRLGSYTEFSARFSGRQSMGYFTPDSVAADQELAAIWHASHRRLFEISDQLTNRGRVWIFTEEAQNAFPILRQRRRETEGAWKARLGKHAADQFKNLLPASRLTSMGVTRNATEEENALRKLLSSPSASAREVGRLYKEAALQVAPTLVKYADFNPYLASLNMRRNVLIEKFGLKSIIPVHNGYEDATTHLVSSSDPESLILAAFAFESSRTGSFQNLLTKISRFSPSVKVSMFQGILSDVVSWTDFEHGLVTSEGMSQYDMPPRAFEFDGGYIFELPDMTYGDWRDFKRHRMQSYVPKPLDTKWGYMVPPMAGLLDGSENSQFHGSTGLVREGVGIMENLFNEVTELSEVDARYAVTRLHYRPAISRFNPREAWHLLRLRTADTAHPFVRKIMWPTYDALMAASPNIFSNLKLRSERSNVAFP